MTFFSDWCRTHRLEFLTARGCFHGGTLIDIGGTRMTILFATWNQKATNSVRDVPCKWELSTQDTSSPLPTGPRSTYTCRKQRWDIDGSKSGYQEEIVEVRPHLRKELLRDQERLASIGELIQREEDREDE